MDHSSHNVISPETWLTLWAWAPGICGRSTRTWLLLVDAVSQVVQEEAAVCAERSAKISKLIQEEKYLQRGRCLKWSEFYFTTPEHRDTIIKACTWKNSLINQWLRFLYTSVFLVCYSRWCHPRRTTMWKIWFLRVIQCVQTRWTAFLDCHKRSWSIRNRSRVMVQDDAATTAEDFDLTKK